MITSRGELLDALRARGLDDAPPSRLRRTIPRSDSPNRPPSRFYRDLFEAELERRRRDPAMSMPPSKKGGGRLVRLQDDQDNDPLVKLSRAAGAEWLHEHFKHELPAMRRRRAVAPVLARAAAKRQHELQRSRLAFQLARRDRGL